MILDRKISIKDILKLAEKFWFCSRHRVHFDPDRESCPQCGHKRLGISNQPIVPIQPWNPQLPGPAYPQPLGPLGPYQQSEPLRWTTYTSDRSSNPAIGTYADQVGTYQTDPISPHQHSGLP